MLGVPAAILTTYGAVSAECAQAMAAGARRVVDADVSIAITGIAGPDGGTADKPVGTVYIAVSAPEGESATLRSAWRTSSHKRACS